MMLFPTSILEVKQHEIYSQTLGLNLGSSVLNKLEIMTN